MIRNLEKHQKYKMAYKPNDFFWGIGIEHETYIETSKLKQVTLKELKENRQPERYCVDYYSIYNHQLLDQALDGLFNEDNKILIPILVNSHTFQKTDINGEHKTTFERVPKLNKNFNGKTIHDIMKQEIPDIFEYEYEKSYIFDGDTIEFMTQNFYKATVNNVMNELEKVEKEFMKALNLLPREGIFKTYAPFKIAQQNYPFASYLTNLKNNAMFNNGTIHINITLPTQLNSKAEIENMELFTKQHQNYARIIQWISPLLVACYGAYDPLCESKTHGDKYAAGSQRVAVSRYIGLGTYDTDKMEVGKILTRSKNSLTNLDWYESFHKKTDYKFLDELGMDFNFNKHFCHGLEFRILESLPYSDIHNILLLLIYLADFSLNNKVTNPTKSKVWHRITEECVHNGKGYRIDVSDQNELFNLFGFIHLSKEPLYVSDVLTIITDFLSEKYKHGKCVSLMIQGELHTPKPFFQLDSIPEIPTPISSKSDSDFNSKPEETTQSIPIAPKPKFWCC
jgi:hypothetical protein